MIIVVVNVIDVITDVITGFVWQGNSRSEFPASDVHWPSDYLLNNFTTNALTLSGTVVTTVDGFPYYQVTGFMHWLTCNSVVNYGKMLYLRHENWSPYGYPPTPDLSSRRLKKKCCPRKNAHEKANTLCVLLWTNSMNSNSLKTFNDFVNVINRLQWASAIWYWFH